MMGWRTEMIDGDEFDALTRMRHVFHWRPGQRKTIKRRHNKRARKAAKRRLFP